MPGPFPSSGGGDAPGVVVGNHGYAFSLIVRASGLDREPSSAPFRRFLALISALQPG
jgi:hypothetical protein